MILLLVLPCLCHESILFLKFHMNSLIKKIKPTHFSSHSSDGNKIQSSAFSRIVQLKPELSKTLKYLFLARSIYFREV